MGILWEIVQSGFIYGQKRKSDTIDDRVLFLEQQLSATQKTMRDLVAKLEEILKTDVDGNGRVG